MGSPKGKLSRFCGGPGDDLKGARGSRMKLGQTSAGRYFQVIYVPDLDSDSVFIITAYDMLEKSKKAYRRRHRRKP